VQFPRYGRERKHNRILFMQDVLVALDERYLPRVTAVIAKGKRPVPFRTRKLSPSAPMVLHW
jgi:hypothetical protein